MTNILSEEHDMDFLSAVARFGPLTVWPTDTNKVNATCRLEKRGLVSVRRMKNCMHVAATIPADDTVTLAAIASVKTEVVSIEITIHTK